MSVLSRLRGRWELVPGMHQPKTARNGAIFLLVVGVLVFAGYTKHIPFAPKGGYTVRAQFARADNAKPGTAVRVHGLTVGKVESVRALPHSAGAEVTMRIDKPDGFTLHRDARAGLWWRTLLGRNMYVELDPGSPSAPPLHSGVIPQSRTETQIELDQVLEPLDADGRRTLRTMIREFDRGFAEPDRARRTIHRLAPALRPVAPALRALRGTGEGDLARLVTRTSRVLGAVSRDEAALGGVIDGTETTLGVTAAHRADLDATLRRAPGTMADIRTTGTRLRATLDALDPLAGALRPGARRLAVAARATRPALRDLDGLLGDADPALRRLRSALERLGSASRTGVPLIGALQPTVRRTRDQLIPFLDRTSPDVGLKVYETIGPALSSVDSALGQFDVYGHSIRFQPGLGEHVIESAPCETYLTDPQVRQKVACDGLMRVMSQLLGSPVRSVPKRKAP